MQKHFFPLATEAAVPRTVQLFLSAVRSGECLERHRGTQQTAGKLTIAVAPGRCELRRQLLLFVLPRLHLLLPRLLVLCRQLRKGQWACEVRWGGKVRLRVLAASSRPGQ